MSEWPRRPSGFWIKAKARRQRLAQNDAAAALHHVKRRAQHAGVVARTSTAAGRRENGGQFREHAILAAHVVGRLHPLPNGGRRSTSSVAPSRSRYVRLECPCGNCSTASGPRELRQVLAQVGFQPGRDPAPRPVERLPRDPVVFMASAVGRPAPGRSRCGECRLKASSVIRSRLKTNSVSAALRIRQLISSAARAGAASTSCTAVADEAAGRERDDAPAAARPIGDLPQAALDATLKGRPGFHALQLRARRLPMDRAAARTSAESCGPVRFASLRAAAARAVPQNPCSVLASAGARRPRMPSRSYSSRSARTTGSGNGRPACAIRGGDGRRRLLVPLARPDIHFVRKPPPAGPRFAQQAGLLLAQRRELVVVIGEERSLRMANQRERAHQLSPSFDPELRRRCDRPAHCASGYRLNEMKLLRCRAADKHFATRGQDQARGDNAGVLGNPSLT